MPTRRRFMKSLSIPLATGLLGCGRAGKNDVAEGPTRPIASRVPKDQKMSPSEFTTVGITLDGQPIDFDLPLLNRAHECDLKIEGVRRDRPKPESGFSYLGLNLESSPLGRAVYWCTPVNSIVFGGNGGDGFHFSFVVSGNRIDASSPIVGSAPDCYPPRDPKRANAILAANFEDFLRLGLRRGYFDTYLFVHSLKDALDIYNPTGREATNLDNYPPLDHETEIARNVANFLNLTPLGYTKSEFQKLQAKYKPLLKFNESQD